MKYFLIAFAFVSCTHVSHKEKKISTQPLDTVKTAAAVTVAPAFLETAFIPGTTGMINKSTATLFGVNIGMLKVPSGKIIACDPMHIDEYGKPFTQIFPTGEFPVQLALAKLEDEETVAFARIFFSNEPVVRWEMALIEGQKPLPVGSIDIEGFSVDGSTACFMDQAAIKSLDPQAVQDFGSPMFQAMDAHYRHNWRYVIYNFGNRNLAAFTTGLGDGRYATYIGFDANGKPCRMVTDFDIFNWKKK